MTRPIAVVCSALLIALLARPQSGLAAEPDVSFDESKDRLTLKIDGKLVATYVFADPVITRPYFANVHGPLGVPISRAFPPVEGRDAMDHADLHPGMWLSFADISGADAWRN